ncbi:helix-turn-helix domain-containing protein [Pseudobacter ginsenosidimutans]|uniref:Helix-turn-helix protein n=1 Tax=Pseudobacter ginsenosidimutans TaxID=661488 RepID=A0A4Q7MUI7_9BACT|nr:AraC family transcriptional regulator [Pseudobacter ginsenosidimutans]QEC42429.1 helix-turn-helix domain-containing protein [Pseudobacter ginsenosidimutans]RZS70720.1 helix-turn-helix protein [Pseudobacter ginsenosidimutans]
MVERESIIQYYTSTNREIPEDLLASQGRASHFNVLQRKNCMATIPFSRRDYYKISIAGGNAVLVTDKGEVPIDRPAIFFNDPEIEFGWKNLSGKQEGYVCLFNDGYLNAELKKELRKLKQRFRDSIYSFLFLEPEQYEQFKNLFRLMESEFAEHSAYRHEIIRSILKLIIYNTLKIQAARSPLQKPLKSERLVNEFIDLLNNQFPIDSPKNSIRLKTPNDFALKLHTHVNHLNHCLKEATGKSTSELIADKLVSEAIDLLQNSDWNITEIGNSLGFSYPQYFNLFFKKHTGKSPRLFRAEPGVIL